MRIIQLVIKISFTTKLAQVLTLLTEQLNNAVKSIHHYNVIILIKCYSSNTSEFSLHVYHRLYQKILCISSITTEYLNPVVTSISHCNFIAFIHCHSPGFI